MEEDLGVRIKAWRVWLGLDQKAFGELVGVTSAAVSAWENGHYEPTGEKQRAIAKVLGISHQRLLFGELPDVRPEKGDAA